jgi:hypothetical protein
MYTPPFIVEQDLISPLRCEEIVDDLFYGVPDVDKDDNIIPRYTYNDIWSEHLYNIIQPFAEESLKERFGVEYKGMKDLMFEIYPQGCEGKQPHAENAVFVKGKWLKVHDHDFTGVLFFNDYNSNPPFESDYEVYGGQLAFPQHDFSFNPERGTLILFPSVPHFINATSEIFAGDLYQFRFNITATRPFLYNPDDFPGDYTTWFREFE